MRRAASGLFALLPFWMVFATAIGAAEAETPDESERWVPSASFSFDVIAQSVRGSIESSDITGPPFPEGCENRPGNFTGELCTQPITSTQPLTPGDSGSDLTTAPLVGLSLELMAPSLIDSLGRPRLFAHADGSLAFGVRRRLAGTGAPSRLGPPPPTSGGGEDDINEATITGQGNRAFSKLESPLFAAGAGLAFSFDLWGRRIRVKPSIEYLLQELELEGKAKRAIQVRGSFMPRPDFEDFRLASFEVSKTVTQHGIGGGIEFEADASRLGPFMLSVFLGGRVYHLLGDLEETLVDDTNSAGETGVGERVSWTFEPDDLAWRGGVGVRFRFLPE